jgi:nucleotide-binding universal stress UspA family protein
MKKIVVGTDASDSSLVAVKQAVELAAATKAELHIVCVAALARDLALRGIAPIVIPDDFDAQAEGAAQKAASDASQVAQKAGVTPHIHVLDGDASTALMKFCADQQADLLVLGAHGMTGASRFLLGSVPNRCTHHATCSVLVAR